MALRGAGFFSFQVEAWRCAAGAIEARRQCLAFISSASMVKSIGAQFASSGGRISSIAIGTIERSATSRRATRWLLRRLAVGQGALLRQAHEVVVHLGSRDHALRDREPVRMGDRVAQGHIGLVSGACGPRPDLLRGLRSTKSFATS